MQAFVSWGVTTIADEAPMPEKALVSAGLPVTMM